MKVSTKHCWDCGSDVLRLFRSTNEKVCHMCGTVIPWYIEEGQKPLLSASRDGEPVLRVAPMAGQRHERTS
jgi:hypothetical protein